MLRIPKFPFLVLLFLLFSQAYNPLQATHIQGVDLTYECLDNCTIRVHFRAYRDCGGNSSIGNGVTFVPITGNCSSLPQPVSAWSNQLTTEVTPICPGAVTNCTSSGQDIDGVQEYYWFRDYDICAADACVFNLTWSDCCRNNDISSGAANNWMFIGSTTLNTIIPGCNSTPQFSNPPVPYLCAGQPFTFNQGATDPDNDSISYSIGPCYDQNNLTLVTYNPGYSPQAPLGPSWNISINAETGDISVLPNPGLVEVGVLCVYANEWRNNLLINQIVRDVQLNVITCTNQMPIAAALPMPNGGITELQGGEVIDTFEVKLCSGEDVNFKIPSLDTDIGDEIKMFWDQSIPGASFFAAGNPAFQDTVSGMNPVAEFSWVAGAPGTYSFLVTIRDNACPIFGTNEYTVVLRVLSGPLNPTITATVDSCLSYSFFADPGSAQGQYSFDWEGEGNLNMNQGTNTQAFSHVFPGPGSYPFNCIMIDTSGCKASLQDTLHIISGPIADAGEPISLCSDFPITLGSPLLNSQTYTWDPPINLNNPFAAEPIFEQTVAGPNPDTTTYTLYASDGSCTAVDIVDVVVYPIPIPAINGNLKICLGDSTTLTAVGGPTAIWNTGSEEVEIKVSPTTNTSYTVNLVENGCASEEFSVTVEVNPGPIPSISGPEKICPGFDAVASGIGGDQWLWNTGETTQTIQLSGLSADSTLTLTGYIDGCPGPEVSYTIGQYELPESKFVTAEVCYGKVSNFIDVSTSQDGEILVWFWDFEDPITGSNNYSSLQNPTHEFSQAGSYNVSLTTETEHGCRNKTTQTIVVNPVPEVSFNVVDICLDEVLALKGVSSASVSEWTWDFADNSSSNDKNTTHLYEEAGPYTIYLNIEDVNGCTNWTKRTVFVHPRPEVDFEYENFCFNSKTQFTNNSVLEDTYGTILFGWNWTFGGTNPVQTSTEKEPLINFTPGTSHNVTLEGYSSEGCAAKITKTVVVPGIPPIKTFNDSVCYNSDAVLMMEGADEEEMTIEWFHGFGDIPFHTGTELVLNEVKATKTYSVGLRDEEGCRFFKVPVKVVVFPMPRIERLEKQSVELPFATAEFSYEILPPFQEENIVNQTWFFGNGAISDNISPVFNYTQPGIYSLGLELEDVNNCVYRYSWEDNVIVTENVLINIPSAFSPNGDNLNDRFSINQKLFEKLDFVVMDRWGRLVYQTHDLNFEWDGMDRNGALLPEGVYVYHLNALTYRGIPYSKAGSITLIR